MPFHEFNPFTGRLKQTMRFVPATPIKPRLLHISDEPKMMYDSIKTKPVGAPSYTTNAEPKYSSPGIEKLMKKKAFFLADLDRPIYLYAGTKDKILFGITLAGMAIGLLNGGYFIYTLATKKD